jgi:hypothetical protein
MVQTFDGGVILCGYSNSNISGDKRKTPSTIAMTSG